MKFLRPLLATTLAVASFSLAQAASTDKPHADPNATKTASSNNNQDEPAPTGIGALGPRNKAEEERRRNLNIYNKDQRDRARLQQEAALAEARGFQNQIVSLRKAGPVVAGGVAAGAKAAGRGAAGGLDALVSAVTRGAEAITGVAPELALAVKTLPSMETIREAEAEMADKQKADADKQKAADAGGGRAPASSSTLRRLPV